jgi:hypothetical protein
MVNATELATLLFGSLGPALPFLEKVGERVVVGVSSDAVKNLGKSTLDKAKNIWEKLNPQFKQKETAQKAIAKFLQRPDEISQFSLISEIRDILEENPDLAQELLKLMKEQDLGNHKVDQSINFQRGGVSIRGDFNNTNGTFVGGSQINLDTK